MTAATSCHGKLRADARWLPRHSKEARCYASRYAIPRTALSLKLEGRFTGDDAENTRTLMARCRDGMRLVVDLTEVTFIDSVGEEALVVFWPVRGGIRCPNILYARDMRAPASSPCSGSGHRMANTSGASRTNVRRRRAHRTSAGKRGSLKTLGKHDVTFHGFIVSFRGVRAAVSRPAVYHQFRPH